MDKYNEDYRATLIKLGVDFKEREHPIHRRYRKIEKAKEELKRKDEEESAFLKFREEKKIKMRRLMAIAHARRINRRVRNRIRKSTKLITRKKVLIII